MKGNLVPVRIWSVIELKKEDKRKRIGFSIAAAVYLGGSTCLGCEVLSLEV